MVLIDGEFVEDVDVDPKNHKYIGMFRKPYSNTGGGYILCPCGDVLQTMDVSHNHWSMGHWDIPQYQTIL